MAVKDASKPGRIPAREIFVNQLAGARVDHWLRAIWQTLLPSLCRFCGETTGGDLICAGCLAEIPRIGIACSCCGRPMPYPAVCGDCLINKPPQDHCHAPYAYASPVSLLLPRFKYHGSLDTGRLLAEMLCHELPGMMQPPDLLLPVPLHPRRLKQRGFNQAEEIARLVGTRLRIPVAKHHCERIRDTASQAGLSARQRRGNMRNAFRMTKPVAGLRVAIIDDVMTTGQTMMELARTVKAAGARHIALWAVARAVLRK